MSTTEPKLMLCTPYSAKAIERISYPAIGQLKKDGERIMLHKRAHDVQVITRGGHLISTLPRLENVCNDRLPLGWYDGELLFGDLERHLSNGLAYKAIKRTITPDEAALARVELWDYVDDDAYDAGMCTRSYRTRLQILGKFCSGIERHVSVVETRSIMDFDGAVAYYREARERGEEGIVLKDASAPWRAHRSPYQIKFKQILTADLRVVGLVEGMGKNTDSMGALVCETDDGRVRTYVGIGFKPDEAERKRWWALRESVDQDGVWSLEQNPIIEIRYNRIITGVTGKSSLYLTRLVRERLDKTTTSTYDELCAAETCAFGG